MTPQRAKDLIRNGQQNNVIFVGQITSLEDLQPALKQLISNENGTILIGVKECGTVVGVDKNKKVIEEILKEAILNTPFTLSHVPLISYFSIFAIEL